MFEKTATDYSGIYGNKPNDGLCW